MSSSPVAASSESVNLGASGSAAGEPAFKQDAPRADTTAFADAPSLLGPSEGGRVHVSFCTNCAFGGRFVQLRDALEKQFPGIVVIGSNYPPGLLKTALYYLVYVVQGLLLAAALAGDRICGMLGVPVPPLVAKIQESKMMYAMGAWYSGAFVRNSLYSTGAFEVAFDGQQLWSKLAAGDFPTVDYVVDRVRALSGTAA